MTCDEQLMWGSHLPILAACVASTSGDVLELGVGDFSTPFLHAMCGAMGRTLVSVESDEGWLHKLSDGFGCIWHQFHFGDYAKIVPELGRQKWSVALIDNSPGGANRAHAFRVLLPMCGYVIVHDYHQDNEEAIAPLLVNVFHYAILRRYQPPTLLASRTKWLPDVVTHFI